MIDRGAVSAIATAEGSKHKDMRTMRQYWRGISEDGVALVHRSPRNVDVVQEWRGARRST
jgi:hypothetical protein